MKHEQFPALVLEGSLRFTLFTFCVHSACRVIKVGVEFTGLLMSLLVFHLPGVLKHHVEQNWALFFHFYINKKRGSILINVVFLLQPCFQKLCV